MFEWSEVDDQSAYLVVPLRPVFDAFMANALIGAGRHVIGSVASETMQAFFSFQSDLSHQCQYLRLNPEFLCWSRLLLLFRVADESGRRSSSRLS